MTLPLEGLTVVAVEVTRDGAISAPPEVTRAFRFSVSALMFRCPVAASASVP